MVPPAHPRRMSAYAVPALIVLALGFVAAGVRIGDGAIPLGSPRSPAARGGPSVGRPVAQISARSDPLDAELAAATRAAGDLGPASSSRAYPRPVDDSPAAPGALPAPLRSPQPALAPGTSPPDGGPPGEGPGDGDPPPTAGEAVAELLQPLLDLTAPATDPVIDPVTTAVKEATGSLGPPPEPISP